VTPEERSEWEQRRLTGIGASDVAAARHDVYGGAAKVVGVRIGLDDPDPIDPARADRGHRWEQAIADGVLAHTGLYVHGEQMHLSHPEHPRWMCTPDGLLSPKPEASWDDLVAGLEIKTREIGARSQRDYWLTQAQFGMAVSGLPEWLLVVATIDTRLTRSGELVERVADVRYEWVEADPFTQAELGALADELWAWVERGELPPATHGEALGWVKAAHRSAGVLCEDCTATGRINGKKCRTCDGKGTRNVDDPPALDDLAEMIARREELKAGIKEAENEADTIEARIRQEIGDAIESHATGDDGTVWRVRCGLPVRKFTDWSERDFIELWCEHRPSCEPDCIEHRPDLMRSVLDRERAKAELPEEYDAARFKTSDRRLTTKRVRQGRSR
jgi:hypothetical protein